MAKIISLDEIKAEKREALTQMLAAQEEEIARQEALIAEMDKSLEQGIPFTEAQIDQAISSMFSLNQRGEKINKESALLNGKKAEVPYTVFEPIDPKNI